MTDKVLVGFTGYAGAGKDYVADHLSRKLMTVNVKVAQVAWASGVREDIEDELNYGKYMPTIWDKPSTPAVRRLLQWWGTDFRRAEDPDFWVKRGIEKADSVIASAVFFTDTRFPNEVDAITKRGGIIINVWASEKTRVDRIGITPPHESEAYAEELPFHVRVNNDDDNEKPDTDRAFRMIRNMVKR